MLQSGLLDEIPTGNPAPAETAEPAPSSEPPVVDLPEFLKGLDADLAKEPMLKNHKDLNSLIKSYVHAQKAIGKDKVVLPTKNSSKEEWDKVFKALGKPESLEKYGIDAKTSKLGEEMTNALLKQAFDNNLLPSQIKPLVKLLEESLEGEKGKVKAEFEAKLGKELEGLKKEWADGFDKNMTYAKSALKEFADDNFKQYLKDSGMDKDVNLIKLFSKIGKAMGDDQFHGVGAESFNYTQDEIKSKIASIRNDAAGALYNKSHADHKRTVEELERLYKKLA